MVDVAVGGSPVASLGGASNLTAARTHKHWPEIWAAGSATRRKLFSAPAPSGSTGPAKADTGVGAVSVSTAAAAAQAEAAKWSAALEETKKRAEEITSTDVKKQVEFESQESEEPDSQPAACPSTHSVLPTPAPESKEPEVSFARGVSEEAVSEEWVDEVVVPENLVVEFVNAVSTEDSAEQRVKDAKAKAMEEVEELLRERGQEIAALEADAVERAAAVEALRNEVAAADRGVDAAVSRVHMHLSRRSSVIDGLESRLLALEQEEGRLRAIAQELEADNDALPESERQRLWWLERVTSLELQTQDQRKQFAPLDQDCEILEEKLRASSRKLETLRSRLDELDATYKLVGVDIRQLQDNDGLLDAMDVNLAICLSVMPPRGVDFAAGREAEPKNEAGPPLLPSRTPSRRSRSPGTPPPQHAPPTQALPSVLQLPGSQPALMPPLMPESPSVAIAGLRRTAPLTNSPPGAALMPAPVPVDMGLPTRGHA